MGKRDCRGKGSRRHNVPGGSPPTAAQLQCLQGVWEHGANQNSLGDLGSPVEPGTYRCGPHIVEVVPGDIRLAKGNRE